MTASERLLGGRYEVGELLGYGGMAEVHRGRDLRLGRDVAIKMLRTDLARDNTFQMRFRREAQSAATLNHPGIAAIYDTGEERAATGEPLPYIVMEYVNGRTLKDVLAVEGRLQPRRALEITADICAALEFSHRHGIIHRDVKPGNVMVTPNGQVKVMDFGIARDLASGATTMTQTSAVIGTAQYLSPEQARGEAVDARSDVYATGCVLFELLCGHPPFVGDSPVSVAYQHVREDPRAPSELNPEVTPDIDAVVLKALAKNPANRYQSAAEMRADLLRAAAGRPVLATPVMRDAETMLLGQEGQGARVGDPERRRASTWVLVALGVLGVLAVVALIIGLILSNRASEEPVAVPALIGMTEDEAVAELEALGLTADSEPVTGTDCETGTVTGQDPPEGQEVAVGTTVTLEVCAGPAEVTVPQVIGLQEDAAVAELERLNLVPKVEYVESPAREGEVVDADPAPGETVKEGDEITLEVSEGNLVAVPNVVGQDASVAEGILSNSGFSVTRRDADPPTDPSDVGKVARQDPADGHAPRGSTVTIFVYPAPPDLQVGTPTVTDQTVTMTWDNGIFGDVSIDWGDGNVSTGDASGQLTHQYNVPPGTTQEFTIVITAIDHPGRSQSVTVPVSGPEA